MNSGNCSGDMASSSAKKNCGTDPSPRQARCPPPQVSKTPPGALGDPPPMGFQKEREGALLLQPSQGEIRLKPRVESSEPGVGGAQPAAPAHSRGAANQST